MNTANKLTIFRVLLIPIFLWALYSRWASFWPWSMVPLAVFILAAVTDLLDGSIARKRGQVTTFGKFMDPLADKLLVTAALVAFVDFGIINGIIAIVIISREFVVTGLRLIAVSEDKVIAANFWGKLKTILQISTIITILLLEGLPSQFFMEITGIYNGMTSVPRWTFVFTIQDWLIWITTAITVISGIDYVWKNRGSLKMGGNK